MIYEFWLEIDRNMLLVVIPRLTELPYNKERKTSVKEKGNTESGQNHVTFEC